MINLRLHGIDLVDMKLIQAIIQLNIDCSTKELSKISLAIKVPNFICASDIATICNKSNRFPQIARWFAEAILNYNAIAQSLIIAQSSSSMCF